jgi:hypothetical protein
MRTSCIIFYIQVVVLGDKCIGIGGLSHAGNREGFNGG